MLPDGLRRIVTEPLRLAGVPEGDRTALAEQVADEMGDRPGDLALVQMALTETWNRRQSFDNDLLRAYAGVGRIEGAIARAAEDVYTRLVDAERALAEPVFIRLVRLGDTGGATRRLAARVEFDDAKWRLVQKLASKEAKRLVLVGGSEAGETAEIAHEALVTQWPRYQTWLSGNADGADRAADKRTFDALTPRALGWAAAPDARARAKRLAVGADLDAFLGLAERRPAWLSGDEHKFVSESREGALRQQRRERWLFRSVVAAALVAIVGSLAALWQTGEAQRQREEAQRNEQRSFDALARIFAERAWQAMERSDYPLAARYAVAGARTSPANAGEFRSVLGRLLHEAGESRFLVDHKGSVTSVAFSNGGTRVLSVGEDGVRVWDAASGQTLLMSQRPILQAVFSPDGASLAAAMSNGAMQVVEVASGRETLVLSGHEGKIARVAFSPDGTRIVFTDRTSAHVWNAQDGRKISVLRGHENLLEREDDSNQERSIEEVDEWSARRFMAVGGGPPLIQDAAFSPEGARVVTASQDGTARIWDTASGREIAVLRDGGLVDSAAFSPDGSRVLTASSRAARIWDAKSGREITVLGGREIYNNVISASMNRDGTRILTTERRNNSARIWDAESGREIAVLKRHQGELYAAAFSMPRGGWVVTASSDRTVRIWNASNGEEIAVLHGHSGAVRSAAFSPDGQSVVSAADDGTLRIWKAQGRAIEHNALDEDDAVISETLKTFSRDGERILSTYHFHDERLIRLWSSETPHPILTLRGHTDVIVDAVFSPDETRIVSASLDKTARIWDAASGRELAVLRGHERGIKSVRFSPDGKRLVTASGFDETARIWDAESGLQIAVLQHPQYQHVESAAFSSDGSRVISASSRTARIWDAATGREITAVKFEGKLLEDATFSLDGTRLIALVGDGTVHVWDLVHRREIAIMRSSNARLYTAAFSPDGTRVATAAQDGMVHIWDAASGRDIAAFPSGEFKPDHVVGEAVFSPDGAALCCRD
jgi:WD40 repeat protein